MSTLALIGLGSNLGDRTATLQTACSLLCEVPGMTVRAVSSFHETEPAGGPAGQGAFLNAAAALETGLDPPSLVQRLAEIEERLGRVRIDRWGERTLDIDLLLFGDSIIDTPSLTVPHLRMAVRRFVLAPLAEIAPEAVDPLTRRTVADLLDNLDRRPSVIALARPAGDPLLFDRLAQELDADKFSWDKTRDLMDPSRLDLALDRARRAGRWVVTDDWVDERTSELTAGVRQVLTEMRPTFVVVAGAEAEEPLTDRVAKNHPCYPMGCDVPVLRVRTSLPREADKVVWREQVLAEVLAACASARG